MNQIVISNRKPLASRQIPRHRIDLRVRVIPDGQATIHCRSNDLNKEGMGLLLPCDLPAGTRALLEFELPHRPEPLRIRALLRHREGFRSGFEFLHLTSEERHLIRHFCLELPLR
jgi:hypothetical protein